MGLPGRPAVFVKGIECRLADGTIAGSVLRLNNAVKNFRDHTGVSLREAVNAASCAAEAIGISRMKGPRSRQDADIILMDMTVPYMHCTGNSKI